MSAACLRAVLPTAELLAECKAKEADLVRSEAELMLIAHAVWPDSEGERPADMDLHGVTYEEIIAGIGSLHEVTDRLYVENEMLRTKLAAVRDLVNTTRLDLGATR